ACDDRAGPHHRLRADVEKEERGGDERDPADDAGARTARPALRGQTLRAVIDAVPLRRALLADVAPALHADGERPTLRMHETKSCGEDHGPAKFTMRRSMNR